MKLKLPTVVPDLFRDLRDRRLLPVVILLAVGIVAVPFALGGDEATPPAPVAGSSAIDAGEASGEAAAAEPVVLAEVPGLREFEKRLDSFRERNPFKQQLAGPTKAALNELDVTSSTSDAGSTTSTGETSTATSGTATTSTGSSSVTSTTGSTDQSATVTYLTVAADIKVGPIGETRTKKNVRLFSFVPNEDRPIAQFISGEIGGTSAAFTLAPSVTGIEGGKCRPARSNCDYLLLEEGEDAYLTYGPGDRRYRLKLIDVHVEKIDAGEIEDPRNGG